MNYDALFVYLGGRTPRNQFVGALITLLAVFAFYHFLVPGRNSQWCQLTLIFPAVVLLARRLHDMGLTAWPVVLPAGLIIATAWLYLFVPGSEVKGMVSLATVIVCAAFAVWGLVGKSQAEPNRFGPAVA
jgi:uncharacterized membrane protein YhaH (DUF805 family)